MYGHLHPTPTTFGSAKISLYQTPSRYKDRMAYRYGQTSRKTRSGGPRPATALTAAVFVSRSVRALLTTNFFLAHRIYSAVEDRHPEKAFGEEYRRYRAKAPRWLGPPGR